MIGAAVGLGVGAAGVAALAARRAPRGDAGPEPVARMPEPVKLWFWRSRGVRGRVIDRATGGGGWWHVCIDGAELGRNGERLVIDALPTAGVVRAPLDSYRGHDGVAVELEPLDGAETYGAARVLVGTPYALPMYGPGRGLPCSGLAYVCLPAHLRARVDACARYHGPAGTVSPSQIAAALGVNDVEDRHADR
jgi:hypothetical protein